MWDFLLRYEEVKCSHFSKSVLLWQWKKDFRKMIVVVVGRFLDADSLCIASLVLIHPQLQQQSVSI